MRFQRKAFDEQEDDSEGIDPVQNSILPAYVFKEVRELPIEIQILIWSFASRFDTPETHSIAYMQNDTVCESLLTPIKYKLEGSSRINCQSNVRPVLPRPTPTVLVPSCLEASHWMSTTPYVRAMNLGKHHGPQRTSIRYIVASTWDAEPGQISRF
ncbi:hypothetical protein L207DRAFT_73746 [Hyaloscypha variabilis F]|uniref:Uncharacterized protein n=1 Tax=Hyaloscypha variabilis (strain UAMH 11265 / GT02V1 / F) TaxID=1149755 RepID=A0A2J6RFN7_HYAVF|nr:hypothetical protein L207DRAFT_73746 [Hyaloscypha variabilis F]